MSFLNKEFRPDLNSDAVCEFMRLKKENPKVEKRKVLFWHSYTKKVQALGKPAKTFEQWCTVLEFYEEASPQNI